MVWSLCLSLSLSLSVCVCVCARVCVAVIVVIIVLRSEEDELEERMTSPAMQPEKKKTGRKRRKSEIATQFRLVDEEDEEVGLQSCAPPRPVSALLSHPRKTHAEPQLLCRRRARSTTRRSSRLSTWPPASLRTSCAFCLCVPIDDFVTQLPHQSRWSARLL
jgi:hypothetical protein